MANPNPNPSTRFKPGQSGNPGGRPKKVDEAFDKAFDAMQETEGRSLAEWAAANPTEFYKLYARKLTTSADTRSHVLTESVSEEQARVMAEEFLESTRASMGGGKPDRLHEGDAAGLPACQPAQEDSAGA